MAKEKVNKKPNTASASREVRLKAALKANMARRKAQARARDAQDAVDNEANSKDEQ